jgi:hypothetical protein
MTGNLEREKRKWSRSFDDHEDDRSPPSLSPTKLERSKKHQQIGIARDGPVR